MVKDIFNTKEGPPIVVYITDVVVRDQCVKIPGFYNKSTQSGYIL